MTKLSYSTLVSMDLKNGDWFTFTEGPYTGLLAVVTGTIVNAKDQTRIIEYDLVGDGRCASLKNNAVYGLCEFETEKYMSSTVKVNRANSKD